MPSRRRPSRPVVPPLRKALEVSIILALFDVTNHLDRLGERLAGAAGLTTQQWLVLLQIAGDPNFPGSARAGEAPVLASDIARTRGVSRATISAIVSALVAHGFVREDADPADRRRRHLVITAAGAKAIQAIEPARRATNARLLAGLDATAQRRLLRYLHSFLAVVWDVREDEQLAVARARLSRRQRP